jgi:hypothetical protein
MKYYVATGMACLIITIVVFFNESLHEMQTECAVQAKQAQMFLITADDYAIEIELP